MDYVLLDTLVESGMMVVSSISHTLLYGAYTPAAWSLVTTTRPDKYVSRKTAGGRRESKMLYSGV